MIVTEEALTCEECGMVGSAPGIKRHKVKQHGAWRWQDYTDEVFDNFSEIRTQQVFIWEKEHHPEKTWTLWMVSRMLSNHKNARHRRHYIECIDRGPNPLWRRVENIDAAVQVKAQLAEELAKAEAALAAAKKLIAGLP